ncbi:hypothetical protein SY2F82_17240 [Streptomyces sp. Y2F8-2]|nr:hypothetical protein SY2F82_17240 [Streptomyces sp. Y2F8-2]
MVAAVATNEVTGGYIQGSRELWQKRVDCVAPVIGPVTGAVAGTSGAVAAACALESRHSNFCVTY